VLIGGDQDAEGLAAIATLVSVYAQWVPDGQIITTNLWCVEQRVEGIVFASFRALLSSVVSMFVSGL
jgi:hypothetical protein